MKQYSLEELNESVTEHSFPRRSWEGEGFSTEESTYLQKKLFTEQLFTQRTAIS